MPFFFHQGRRQAELQRHAVLEGEVAQSLRCVEDLGRADRHAGGSELLDELGESAEKPAAKHKFSGPGTGLGRSQGSVEVKAGPARAVIPPPPRAP